MYFIIIGHSSDVDLKNIFLQFWLNLRHKSEEYYSYFRPIDLRLISIS